MHHFRWSQYNGRAVCGADASEADHLHVAGEFRRFMFETRELMCELCKKIYLGRGN